MTVKRDDGGCTLTIAESATILDDCHVGDSIAVNGACLTVIEFNANQGWFTVWLANETLQRTDLGAFDMTKIESVVMEIPQATRPREIK